MYLDYAKIEGRCGEPPVLRLQTLSGKTLGALSYVHNLKFEINYSELSTIEFDIPYMVDGEVNPLYRMVESYKVIYTEDHGIYVLLSPTISGEGVKEVKSCRGYSIESQFECKKLFIAEGTYDFWNPAHPDNTILGFTLSLDTDWKAGYIDPKLIGCYRTFDEYNSDALGFLYGTAAEKYNCIIVADVYAKTINAYHTTTSRGSLPIYLDYNNLVENVKVEELSDDMVTKLYPYGADGLNIINANPAGSQYIVDLSYFLASGDLDVTVSGRVLSDRFKKWQKDILDAQDGYMRLVVMRDTKTALSIAADAELADLNGELEALKQEQSAAIHAISLEKEGTDPYEAAVAVLGDVNKKIEEKNKEIAEKTEERDGLLAEVDGYKEQILALCKPLTYGEYFTEDERRILNRFMIEGDIVDETFVATSVDAGFTPVSSAVNNSVVIHDAVCALVESDSDDAPYFYRINGGEISIAAIKRGDEDYAFSTEIVSGILQSLGNEYVLSIQASQIKIGEETYASGLLTLTGTHSGITFTSDDKTTLNSITFSTADGKLYLTADAGQYQSSSVSRELYDHAVDVLDECAWPTMEFSIDTANFLFLDEFAQFKDQLDMGRGIHLNLGSEGQITANLIGVTVDYEDAGSMSLTFSNRYQRKNGAKTLKDMITGASSSGRSFDAGKFTYNQNTNKTNAVSQILAGNFEAAKNKILCADNVHVSIQGSGIHVGDGDYQLRIINDMIAMTNNSWGDVKTAIGRLQNPVGGEMYGINTELLAGNLIVGENIVIESSSSNNETKMFKFDSTGAWLYNSQIMMQRTDADGDANGQILIHPDYGIVAGTSGIYTTKGTDVIPAFLDEDGEVSVDSSGMPENSNFFLDLRDGNAYFRGNIHSGSGSIGGWIIADKCLYAGDGKSYVSMNADGTNNYAFWAGAENAEDAPFSVTKAGNLVAKNGTFSGTLDSNNFSGTMSGELKGVSIDINDGKFAVASNGDVTVKGNIDLSDGVITWGNNAPVKSEFSPDGENDWSSVQRVTDKYRRDWDYSTGNWGTAYRFVGVDGTNGSDGSDGDPRAYLESIGITEIGESVVKSAHIEGAEVWGADIFGGAYYDLYKCGRLQLSYELDTSDNYVIPMLQYHSLREDGTPSSLIFGVYDIGINNGAQPCAEMFLGNTSVLSVSPGYFNGIGYYGYVNCDGLWSFRDEVDFSNAYVTFNSSKVTGLTARFG